MLGFEAKVTSKKNIIRINKQEIEEAHWFSSKEIVNLIRNNQLLLPKKEAIAYNLIQDWLKNN